MAVSGRGPTLPATAVPSENPPNFTAPSTLRATSHALANPSNGRATDSWSVTELLVNGIRRRGSVPGFGSMILAQLVRTVYVAPRPKTRRSRVEGAGRRRAVARAHLQGAHDDRTVASGQAGISSLLLRPAALVGRWVGLPTSTAVGSRSSSDLSMGLTEIMELARRMLTLLLALDLLLTFDVSNSRVTAPVAGHVSDPPPQGGRPRFQSVPLGPSPSILLVGQFAH